MRRRVLLDTDLDSGLRRGIPGVVVLVVVAALTQLIVAAATHESVVRVLLVQAIVTPLTLAVGLLAARRIARRR